MLYEWRTKLWALSEDRLDIRLLNVCIMYMCEPIYEMKELKSIETEITWNGTAIALTDGYSLDVLLILWAHRIINMTLMMCALWSFSWHLQRTIIVIIPGTAKANFVGQKLNEKTKRNKTLFLFGKHG